LTKSPNKNILGISAYYHDAAAALLSDGEIVAAAQEERFTRKKHDSSFPRHAIEYCLEESGLNIANLDSIVFYDKPLVKFERLLETYLSYAPNGFRSFVAAMPIWLKEKLFLKNTLKRELEKQGFEVVSALCKMGRTPKEDIGVRDDQKINIGCFESMCNPIAQAFVINSENTEFNIVVGLCVGHDSLFLKYADAPCTVLAAKDRLLGHNPLAAIYTIDSYYRSLKQ